MTAFTLRRVVRPRITLLAVGTSTTKKLTSRFLVLSLSPKRTRRGIIPVEFTFYLPKPKMGVHQGNDVTSWVCELLQAVPGDDVNGATRVNQNSPYNYACYLRLNDQGVIVWRGESRGFLFTKHHCGHRYVGPLLSGEYLCALLS